MHNTIKKFAPILLINTTIVSVLNYFSYHAIIQISQAGSNTIPTKLILEITSTIVIHIITLSALPLILSATNRKLTSYLTLIILGAFYTTYMTGMKAAGPTIAIVAFGYLAVYGYSKAKAIYDYYRTK